MEGDNASMLREKFVEPQAQPPNHEQSDKKPELDQSDAVLVHVDQIPAHIPQPASPASPSASLLHSLLPTRKRNFVPFDSETAKTSENTQRLRLLWVVLIGVLSVVSVVVGVGMIVAFSSKLHKEVNRHRSTPTLSSSAAQPPDTTSPSTPPASTESPAEALNDVLSSLTDRGFFMPSYEYGLGFPSDTSGDGQKLFEAVDWYQAEYDARTISAADVNAALNDILPTLANRKAEATHSLPENVFQLDMLSQRTLWMYLRERRSKIPNLMTLLRQHIQGKQAAAAAAAAAKNSNSQQTQKELEEAAVAEVDKWLQEASIEKWVRDFWWRHDQATEDLISKFQPQMDILISEALHQEASNGTHPPDSPKDPMDQLTRFLSSNLYYSTPKVTNGFVDTDSPIGSGANPPGGKRRTARRVLLGGEGSTSQPDQQGQGEGQEDGSTSTPEKQGEVLEMPSDDGPKNAWPFAIELSAYEFPTIIIPVVFHVLSYMDSGYQQPGGAYWDATNPYQRLVDLLNVRFNNESSIQFAFELQEVRHDVRTFPYLKMDNYSNWQRCAREKNECFELLAEVHNLDVGTVVNVWVGGTIVNSVEEEDCKGCVEGYTWTAPYVWASDNPLKDTQTWPKQHIYLGWDMVDPAVYNNADAWEFGGYMLAHQFAHFLGLSHSSKGGCEGKEGKDFVEDTPDSQRAPYQHLYLMADRWCERMRAGYRGLIVDDMKKFDSCPGDSYMDNVFNFMSEGPLPCALYFTPGQGFLMQVLMKHFRPTMWLAGQVNN